MKRPRRSTRAAMVSAIAILAVLAYLRDPAWLAAHTHGLHEWETAADGTRYRWAAGRSSFFVPAGVDAVTLPIRTTFNGGVDWPVVVTVSIDDRVAERLTLADSEWHYVRLTLPPPGRRSTRRVDVHADRTRAEERAVQLGEIAFR